MRIKTGENRLVQQHTADRNIKKQPPPAALPINPNNDRQIKTCLSTAVAENNNNIYIQLTCHHHSRRKPKAKTGKGSMYFLKSTTAERERALLVPTTPTKLLPQRLVRPGQPETPLCHFHQATTAWRAYALAGSPVSLHSSPRGRHCDHFFVVTTTTTTMMTTSTVPKMMAHMTFLRRALLWYVAACRVLSAAASTFISAEAMLSSM
eukprot:scpid77610/ scgid17293/ 